MEQIPVVLFPTLKGVASRLVSHDLSHGPAVHVEIGIWCLMIVLYVVGASAS